MTDRVGSLLGFPRATRLLKRYEYNTVLREPERRASSKGVRLSARANHLGYARLGIMVPKRQVKRAVDRSRLKRLIRESFRHRFPRQRSVDVVVGVRREVLKLTNNEIYQQLDKLWRRMDTYNA